MSVDNKTVCWIVRRNTNCHAIPNNYFDIEFLHFPTKASIDNHAIFKSHLVSSSTEHISDLTFYVY